MKLIKAVLSLYQCSIKGLLRVYRARLAVERLIRKRMLPHT